MGEGQSGGNLGDFFTASRGRGGIFLAQGGFVRDEPVI
jgi:hypothetical protein